METKDWLPYLISGLSLVVSSIALYMGQFRRAKLKIIVGPDIHIYHPVDGGTAFYIPVIFTNKSPTRGLVEEIYLRMRTPSGRTYQLKWLEEIRLTIRDWNYDHLDNAKPFTIGGFESVSKVCWFLWPEVREPLELVAGQYSVSIEATSDKGKKPEIKKQKTLIISGETEKTLNLRKSSKDPKARIHYFEGDSEIAQVIE